MSKHYGSQIIKKVLEMRKSGKNNREIREHFNLSKK